MRDRRERSAAAGAVIRWDYCSELAADELHTALTAADRSLAPKQRGSIMKELTSRGNQLTTDEVVRLNRAWARKHGVFGA